MKLRHKDDKHFDHFPAKQPRLVGNEITNGQAPKKFAANQTQEPGTSNRQISIEHQDEEDIDGKDITKQDQIKLLSVLFEDRNVGTVTTLSPGAGLQSMANYIIENADKFQKKPKKKIEIPPDQLEPATVDEAISSKEKLKQSFFEDWKEYIETHFKRPHNVIYDKEMCNRLLHQHFPYCRTPLIEHMVEEFRGRFSTAAWFCFFVECKLGFLLRQYSLHIEQTAWVIIAQPNLHPRKRRVNWIPNPEDGPLAHSIREFYSKMRVFRADYDQLFHENIDRLITCENNEAGIGKEFECLVCMGNFKLSRAVSCNLNPFDQLMRQEPSTSKMNKSDHQFHYFCVECLIGHARAATQEAPLAIGGIGLQCMAPDCANPILFSECRFYIPPNVRRILNARIVEENLGAANLANLERCNECNYAMIIEASPDEIRVFSCEKCRAQYCRKCHRPWDDLHIGRPCDEIEAIIRRCHHCSLPFVKADGCNKMACRCGATMCYICRAQNITYAHFCQHYRNPGQKNCKQCKKKCLLWQPEDEADRAALGIVHVEAQQAGVTFNDNK